MNNTDVMLAVCVMALAVLMVKPASACSVPESKTLPSNFGLVEMADTILLAEAMAHEKRSRVMVPNPGVSRTYVKGIHGCVRFNVLKSLKGKLPKTLCLAGWIAEPTGIEASWSRPRKGAMSGACVAFDYAVGHQYLLFLNSKDNKFHVLSSPFARVNEEVSGENDPWTVGIKKYITVSQLPSYVEKEKALKKLHLESKTDSEIHKDVSRYLRYPWPSKSVQALLTYLSPKNDVRIIRRTLFILANKDPGKSQAAVEKLLNTKEAKKLTSPLAEYAVNHSFPHYWIRLAEVVISSDQMPEWHFQNLLADNLKHLSARKNIEVTLKCKQPTCERSHILDDKLHPVLNAFIDGKYETHVDESLLLADFGDPAVIKWAEGILARRTGSSTGFALRILARSPMGAMREFLLDAFCNHRNKLLDVLAGYRDSDWWGRKDRVAELAITPRLNVKEKEALLDVLHYWTSAEKGGEWKSVAYVLRENLEKGEPPNKFFFPAIKPLACER